MSKLTIASLHDSLTRLLGAGAVYATEVGSLDREEADALIETRLGRRPRFFAYPYGYHDARVRAVAGTRYNGCFTTRLDYLGLSIKLDALPRLDTHYLRSPALVRGLEGKSAQSYIMLRRALRRLRGQ